MPSSASSLHRTGVSKERSSSLILLIPRPKLYKSFWHCSIESVRPASSKTNSVHDRSHAFSIFVACVLVFLRKEAQPHTSDSLESGGKSAFSDKMAAEAAWWLSQSLFNFLGKRQNTEPSNSAGDNLGRGPVLLVAAVVLVSVMVFEQTKKADTPFFSLFSLRL